MCLGILGVLLTPIMDMLITSNRVATSARRMLDTTLYAQGLLEAMAELAPGELPDHNGELLGKETPAGSHPGRWREIAAELSAEPPFPLAHRSIRIQHLRDGNVEISINVEWYGVVGDEKTKQAITLRELSVQRGL